MRIENLEIVRGATRVGPLDADFPAGAVSVVTGASGAGKTSLCLMLAGFLTPSAGRMTAGPAALVPQNPREWVNPRHTIDQVIAHTGATRGVLRTNTERRSIADRARIPVSLLDRPCGGLSGGQAARVCMARALATGLTSIACDEPTAALDASNAAGIARLLVEVAASGLAVVWATHDRDLALAIVDDAHHLALTA